MIAHVGCQEEEGQLEATDQVEGWLRKRTPKTNLAETSPGQALII